MNFKVRKPNDEEREALASYLIVADDKDDGLAWDIVDDALIGIFTHDAPNEPKSNSNSCYAATWRNSRKK